MPETSSESVMSVFCKEIDFMTLIIIQVVAFHLMSAEVVSIFLSRVGIP